jgi:F420-non-reducing hydrogenase iron-sulfur subunit
VIVAAGPGAPKEGSLTAPATFEPVILGFTCNWCSYRAADLAGTARMKYPPNVRLVRLMCSGRLEPEFVLRAFADGADAVLVTGCWPADCHYRIQNVKALRRFLLLRRTIAGLGIEPERLGRFYASAAEGRQLAAELTRVTEEVRALGPLRWPARRRADDGPGRTPSGTEADEGESAPPSRAAAPDATAAPSGTVAQATAAARAGAPAEVPA